MSQQSFYRLIKVGTGPVGRSSTISKFLFCRVVWSDLNITSATFQAFSSIRLEDRDYLNMIFKTKKVDAFSSKFVWNSDTARKKSKIKLAVFFKVFWSEIRKNLFFPKIPSFPDFLAGNWINVFFVNSFSILTSYFLLFPIFSLAIELWKFLPKMSESPYHIMIIDFKDNEMNM